MINSVIKRTLEANSDVENAQPSLKQDCSDVVHISIFFDGTGNNKTKDEDKKKWSNPARLWRNAEIFKERELASLGQNKSSIHTIYVSGVGTTFNGDLNFLQRGVAILEDHSGLGLGAGLGGTRRLDYGDFQVNEALKNALIINAKKAEKDISEYVNNEKKSSFSEVNQKLKEHRLIKKINISTFGFSRGAALARAFTNQFIWDCDSTCVDLQYGGSPIEFTFLGLFDTVASFGLPATNLVNNLSFTGRDLVIDERVKKCVHLIAGNEQRFSFPLDLISSKDGKLKNADWIEIVYPGMHSDVGGGYALAEDDTEISDNFARIPLKKMLDEAINMGVKFYSYDELNAQHTDIFDQQFKIEDETQRLFDAVSAEMSATGNMDQQVQASMKIFYSAYGSLSREGIKTQNQKDRSGFKDILVNGFIPWGPANMATEMDRLQTLQKATAPELTGWKKIFIWLSPVAKTYQWLLSIDDWAFESWNQEASSDVKDFYLKYIHDSKYGFLANVEPFSYFRQRTIYESRRSQKGKEVDEKIFQDQRECTDHRTVYDSYRKLQEMDAEEQRIQDLLDGVEKNITQEQFHDAFMQAKNKEKSEIYS